MVFAATFAVFISAMLLAVVNGVSVVIPLIAGFCIFFVAGIINGFSIADLLSMTCNGAKNSLSIVKLMMFIGCLTAVWRADGTIAYFIYYGIRMVSPELFIFLCFALTAMMSYFLGSSFGTVGTCGVMLMILAKSGNADIAITAGAIISGAYFGDRTSPVSSSAYLTSVMTEIDHEKNIRMLLKTGTVPLVITIVFFIYISVTNPIESVGTNIMDELEKTFVLSPLTLLPALVLLILPWTKVSISWTILASTICAAMTAHFVQNISWYNILGYMIAGYRNLSESLGNIMSGGGIISMIEVIAVVLISSAYGGILKGTGAAENITSLLEKMADTVGLAVTQICLGIITSAVFCNQTIATILSVQLMKEIYEKKGASSEEMASDIGNSIITIAGLIPWSIACAVPLSMLGIGSEAIPWSVFLWFNPLCYIFTKRLFFKKNKIKKNVYD